MSAPPPDTGPACPVCGKRRQERFRPFCSARCARLDLSRWLKGVYAIPARDEDEGEGSGPTAGGPAEGA